MLEAPRGQNHHRDQTNPQLPVKGAAVRYMILLALALFVLAACDVENGDDVAAESTDDIEVVDTDDDATEDPTPTPEPDPTETPEPEPANTPEPEPTPVPEARGPPFDGVAAFYHFDVGQADATLIVAPDGVVLIDAGDWQRSDVVPHIELAGVDAIDLVILTHPHADHIGQVPQVLDRFDVGEVWMSGWQHDSQTFERTVDAVLDSDTGYHEPRAGETETFGDLVVEVINPASDPVDIHDTVSVRVSYGDFAAIYTGDAEVTHESGMIARGHDLSANILSLGHHGSSTSTSADFLSAVNPDVAIFSAAQDSQYGHPHAEVVDRVQAAGVHLYGTAIHGNIVITTDGAGYDLEIEREGNIEISAPEPTPVPESEPEPEPQPADEQPDPVPGCVDINSAGFDELQQIVQIGPDRAQQIIDLRPFASVDGMARISGIGPARLDEIKAQGLACVR